MAVVTVKSAQITNRDALPRVLNVGRVSGAFEKHPKAIAAIANGDSIASKYIFFEVPSNAIVSSVKISCPDIGTTALGDVGLYRTTGDGGAVVDADFFASAVSLSGGALNKSEIVNEAGAVMTVADMEKPLWQALGLAADPQVMYDVVLTLTAASDAAGSVLLEVDYTY